ncbi:MAG: DUF1538 domain-containing protein [Treponema sp.]|nr:DUF1538 domain-containing protein [Treponema sp.]
MNLVQKLKETVFSVLPIMAIVLILGFTVAPLNSILIVRFVAGGILLILGLTIFTWGVDIGILPLGEKCGAALTSKKNLVLLLIAAFAIGFLVTIAEPDVQVLADQIKNLLIISNKWLFVFLIAIGVGLFVMLGLLRIVLNWKLRWVLIISYVILFVMAFFTGKFQEVAFDAGGATTGPMTVPFIMALGMGVSAVRSKKSAEDSDSSFGLTGIASIGPVAAVCIYGVIEFIRIKSTGTFQGVTVSPANLEAEIFSQKFFGLGIFIVNIPEILREVSLALLPLVIMFVVFQIFLLKLPRKQVSRIIMGFIYSFVGLVIFLLGVKGGFMGAGENLGFILGKKACELAWGWKAFLIIIGFVFGAVIVCAEPAVWVLTEQVESASAGNIRRKVLLVTLSVGVAISIVLSIVRIMFNFNLLYILIPGYAIALVLTFFCPPLFTGIAFDSGGVASGPMTSTFLLSFTIGISGATAKTGTMTDGFGVIALVAMTPLIAIQILGIIYKIKTSRKKTEAALEEK